MARLGWKALAVVAMAIVASDGDQAAAQETSAPAPVLVELFTSQGCSSCPPADSFLGELAEDPRVVALAWHVDYWDDLWIPFSGSWADPYAASAHTERQQRYNLTLRQVAGVYTPQMVIGGVYERVGHRRNEVDAAIAAVRTGSARSGIDLDVTRTSDGNLVVTVTGSMNAAATVWLAEYVPSAGTTVAGGENDGRTLTNHHAVTAVEALGTWPGGSVTYRPVEAPAHCAVWVQADPQGAVLAAGYCPG